MTNLQTWAALPHDWKLVRLEDLGDKDAAFADGPFGSNLKTEHYRPSGARVVRLQNIGMGKFLDGDKAYIALDHYETLRRHKVEPGDVVVAALGDGARPAGRACLVPRDFGAGIVKADCFRVRLPDALVYGPYLVFVMTSAQFLRQVADRMRGATRPRMTLKILRESVIPLPPLAEQKRLAKLLTEQMAVVEQLRSAALEQMKELTNLPSRLLQRALSGEL